MGVMPKGKKKAASSGKQRERAVRKALRNERIRQRYREGDPEYKNLTKQLSSQGMKLKDVPGDGNCLFRALVDQMDDPYITHRNLRTNIVEYMRLHKDDFEPFLEEEISFDEYILEMRKDGTYGGNDSIVAFARMHNVTVVIHQPDSPRWEVHGNSNGPGTAAVPATKRRNVYHIAYLDGEHYCSVVPINTLAQEGPVSSQDVSSRLTPHHNHSGAVGMSGIRGMCDDKNNNTSLEALMKATGCKDKHLAESILKENSYNEDLAIVELLQIMSISGDIPHFDVTPSKTSLPSPLPMSGKELKQKKETHVAEKQMTKEKKSATPLVHLSNRERKELAKKERKERKREERRHEKKAEDSVPLTDNVGSLMI